MKRGQSSLEYLFIGGVAIVMVLIAVKYLEPAAKGVPITGVAYIDPELSPEKPGYNHPVTWIIYRYPEGCKAKSTCDFYVSVNLHYNRTGDEKYEIFLNANGDKSKIRKIQVSLCTGNTYAWYADKSPKFGATLPSTRRGEILSESEFPCTVYIMAWEK